ncbi:MAG: hypothetical protein JNM38_19515 [Acidobacteria bacterium]|jgi:hypothetical protein|nr:hypothetical protein [Acidobacteriota bacterium]
MARHQGGETVGAGFFMNVAEWNVETFSGDGGVLPGGAETVYRQVPTLVLLMAAPLLGAAFAMFLPFIGLALVAQYFAKQAWAFVRDMSHAALVAMSPRMAAGEAYLTGDKSQAAKADGPEARLEKLDDALKAKDDSTPKA